MKTKPPSTPKLPKRLSLVAQTVDSLCEGIQNGHWQKHLPGERDLCENLQVSRRTLRSALQELQRQGWLEVQGRLRRRIKNRRNNAAPEVKKKTIGILMAGSFLSLPSRISFVMDTLRAKLTAAGCLVQFHINPAVYAGNPKRVLAQFVADHPATVWIVLSAPEPMQQWLSHQKVNCLLLGSCAPGISLPSVDVDLHAACHHAGGLLWRKGHRRIALILTKSIYGGDIASEEGLRDALKDMPGAQIQVMRHDNTTAHLCLLIDECLRSPNPPTAYLVGGVPRVLTVMMHLMRRGQRIPKDVTVISRDNDPMLDSTSPTVARYAIQPAQLASRIVLAVRQLAETHTVPSMSMRLMPTFISGESI